VALDGRRIAWRCFLGMARTGMNLLFRAAVETAEEAIVDALFAAETTTGRDGHTIPALPISKTLELLRMGGVRLN